METNTASVQTADLQLAIAEAMLLFSETASYHSDASVRAVLQEAVTCLRGHYQRLEQPEDRYIVAFVGLTNVGKSTLLNALLGRDLAPRKAGPCTAAPVEFMKADHLHVVADYTDTAHRDYYACEADQDVHDHLARLAVEGGDDQARRPCRIEVGIPNMPGPDKLVIADTPGFGAAFVGEEQGTHDVIVTDYLRRVASQVWWVVSAAQGITQREKAFHANYLSDICEDLIVTKCEDWNDQDKHRWSRRFAESLGRRWLNCHYVSGKRGIVAKKNGDVEMLKEAGISHLEERLFELADPRKRAVAISNALESLIGEIKRWRSNYRDRMGRALLRPWRPDSWSRWTWFLHTRCSSNALGSFWRGLDE